MFKHHRSYLFLIVLTIIGALVHFYNLNWGASYYFHPDERNIASSISQLSFPDRLNPNFFAYGSLPIYVIYTTGLITNLLTSCVISLQTCIENGVPDSAMTVLFEDAILIGRIYSATFATLLIPIIFLIGKKLGGIKAGLIAAFLTTFSTGVIQFAHFTTFEMWTTFFVTLQLLLALMYLKEGSKKSLTLLALVTGILFSIKVSNAVLISVPALSIILFSLSKTNSLKTWIVSKHGFLLSVISVLYITVVSLCIYLLTNPFVFLDTTSFFGSMRYESEVALGTLHVFYTGEFYNSIPVLFHVTKVFPFLLNPILFILSGISLGFLFYSCIKHKNKKEFLLLFTFLILFFSSSFMYVKWVRYMFPTLPFLYLAVAQFLTFLEKPKGRTHQLLTRFLISLVFICSIVFSVSYTIVAFVEEDTRLQARDFAVTSIPSDAVIISEVYDLGITPFNSSFENITLFNFYELDSENTEKSNELYQLLSESEYVILPSQRILATRLSNRSVFPKGHEFYSNLTSDTNSYTLLYETPCSIFCKITYLGDPIMRFEGTANVFDRPHLQIYRINK